MLFKGKVTDENFEEILENQDKESLLECYRFLKEEEKVLLTERKKLDFDIKFFDKKMEILKSGFADLEEDKRKLEREKISFETEKKLTGDMSIKACREDMAVSLFAGVNNYLALKKRYRDLLKIFHPDNMCGDTEMVTLINEQYEKLKGDFEFGFRSVN